MYSKTSSFIVFKFIAHALVFSFDYTEHGMVQNEMHGVLHKTVFLRIFRPNSRI